MADAETRSTLPQPDVPDDQGSTQHAGLREGRGGSRDAVMRLWVAILLAFISSMAGAQNQPTPTRLYFKLGAGGGRADSVSGLLMTGAVIVQSNWVAVTFSPLEVLLHAGDSGPYYTDTFDNGQSRCRNSSNGQFAETSNCSPIAAHWGAVADITFAQLVLVPSRNRR